MSEVVPFDPTGQIDLNFGRYLIEREVELSSHMIGRIPDYAFSMDYTIRRKMDAIGPLRAVGQALTAATVPYFRQLKLMDAVAVGPKQFPEVHTMGVECAHTLGLGIPQIFIFFDPRPNGWTYATNDVDQVIVLTSGLLEALNPLELKSVIGHECGHIHNQHMVYNTLWVHLTNPIAGAILMAALKTLSFGFFRLLNFALGTSLKYIFGRWHRCAEFTCDRAGLICCGDLEAALQAEGKLALGHADSIKGFSAEEYAKQLEEIDKSPLRFLEVFHSHPLGPKRIEAMKLFAESEVLYGWRPEMQAGKEPTSKVDVDKACEKLVI